MAYAIDTPGENLTPINDCYGSLTAAAGTELLQLVPPPADTARACISTFSYDNGVTAHTMTFMVSMFITATSADCAAGQAVIALSQAPTAFDGSIIAAGDFLSFLNDDGTYGYGKVSSVSGLNITMTASLSKKIAKGGTVWFHGAPADHTGRQFTLKASAVTTFIGGDFRLRAASAYQKGEPLLAHVNNITNAGIWTWLGYYYD